MPAHKTVRTQLVCRECDHAYTTTLRGRSTNCPRCRTNRYVPMNPEWEGPITNLTENALAILDREPVWCYCNRCTHEWQSRAISNGRQRCPNCKCGIRIPERTEETTGPFPGVRIRAPRKIRKTSPKRTAVPKRVVPTVSVPTWGASAIMPQPAPVHPLAAAMRPRGTGRPMTPVSRSESPSRHVSAVPRGVPDTPDRRLTAARLVGVAGRYRINVRATQGQCEVLDSNFGKCESSANTVLSLHPGTVMESAVKCCVTHSLVLADELNSVDIPTA